MFSSKGVDKSDKPCVALSCSVCVLCASCPLHSVLVEACQHCVNVKSAEEVSEKMYLKSIPEA